ncbi:WD40-repeat-containing domain protein [Zychaea mexicana]|uniref:WD40-repeat-containing domain protein n=1 Tax=Zychaea mexicana TaxID=64656 RepID=UPI0022FED66C|nr:WD40-repeat-containing domain protein [Zychaea mexicana]KAI9492432.1 WD40-repeat-containing domain protein [Zychaea mexicana]
MSAPFLTFLNIPTPLYQEDRSVFPATDHNHHQLSTSSAAAATTTYVAIVSRHGKTFTKILNPSSKSSPHFSRGRKRAFSGGNSGFFNPLMKQPASLQKKTKLLLFWSPGSNKRVGDEQRASLNSTSDDKNQTCMLYKLPTEILVRILQYLNTAANVLQVAQTSRRLFTTCHDHHLWHRLFSQHYFTLATAPSERCLQLYKDHVELDRRWTQGSAHVFYMNDDESHQDSIYATAWIDPQTIVSVSRDRSIKVWDLATRKCLLTRNDAHEGSILCLTLLLQEKTTTLKTGAEFAVTGSSDTTCTVWSLPNWDRIRQFSGHTHSVLSVLAINDDMVATASRDTTVQIWRVTDGKVCHVMHGHSEAVNAVKRLDDQRIVSASGDGTLKIWSIETGACLETLTSDIGGLSCMQVVNSQTIWAGGLSSHIQIWELSTCGNLWKTVTIMNSGHTNLLRTIDSFKDKVVTAGYDKVIKVWDSRTGKCLLNFQSGHASKIFSVLLGKTSIVSAGHDKRIMVLDFAYLLSKELVRL